MRFLPLLPVLAFPLFADVSAPPADAPADHQGSRQCVAQAAAGSILLHAKDATVHGQNIRYEPNPKKNTIGYWTHAEDWVSWEFEVIKAGKFTIEATQGCGNGSGGSEVEFKIGEKTLTMIVDETGGFQKWKKREIGTVELPAGKHMLAVKAKTKPHGAVMDLQQVLLTPATK